jgi:predicted small lipoprotein YifL
MAHTRSPIQTPLLLMTLLALAACGGGESSDPVPPPPTNPPSPPVSGPAWPQFSRDAQHTAASAIATPPLTRIIWQTPVDLAPLYSGQGGYLLTHYGSPVISGQNTVLVPVKKASNGDFGVEARSGGNGGLIWSAASDYVVPPHNWFPSFNIALSGSRVYIPGAGGKLFYRDAVDSATGTLQTAVFYGATAYNAAKAQLDSAVMISTPITIDTAGNAWFGFFVTAANPANLVSGIARVAPDGSGAWRAASALANDSAIDRVAMNSAPAIAIDGNSVYVAVSSAAGQGYLVRLDAATLTTLSRVALVEPGTGTPARITGDSTSSPAVGPDGDVFFGVLETLRGTHNNRGWLLHFNAALDQSKVPGSFGWDNTPSIVPATAVPSYTGTSTYLLAMKYNNYAGSGTGDGQNRMAIVDPSRSQADRVTPAVQVMTEVLTILGPTPDADHPGGVREWCVNTGAVDPATRSMLINNEDGKLYRWNLATNQLSESIVFNNGLGQSYTPTAIGADGTVYAINNAVLFAVGR